MALENKQCGEDIVSIFFVGAEKPLFDGEEIPIGETGRRLDVCALLEGRDIDKNFVVVVGISSSALPPK